MVQPRTAYRTRLAESADDIRAAQQLRFEVFNVELQEGLGESWQNRLDADRFDAACDHLVIEHTPTGKIVGTYRLQTGTMAAAANGYYSAQEFDFAPFEPYRGEIVELGRACVHQDHRRSGVIDLLWRGIAAYARERGCRYLIGCSSLPSQDPALGRAMHAQLIPEFLAAEPFRTSPRREQALPEATPLADCPKPPRLLRTYLTVGARICGEPALDREFGTIDFLTMIDLTTLPAAASARFLS
jgi:putative hemolysin